MSATELQSAAAPDTLPHGLSADRGAARPWSQRAALTATRLLSRGPRRPGRRSFLRTAALVGTALLVNPIDFILRPQSAYASVCGPANECSQGWTAFCCTVNSGANTCPEGSFAAGWWKVSSSAFCRGEDRYIVDCNREPDATCDCTCAQSDCDRRRVCCNNFRYGQCNQQVPGVTQVVCRIVICTPPWEWDPSCTTTVRTDERTRDHSASCQPGTNPTEIDLVYLDAGLVGAAVGAPLAAEETLPDGGSWRRYVDGVITRTAESSIVLAAGPTGIAYRDVGGPAGELGHLLGPSAPLGDGEVLPAENGAVYAGPNRPGVAIPEPLRSAYEARGGPLGWMGFPTAIDDAPGDRQRVWFTSTWSLVLAPSSGEVRLLPGDVELSDAADEWPPTASVQRVEGETRVQTAVAVSRHTHDGPVDAVVLASADTFADALAGGVLAGLDGGPVLLTSPRQLSEAAFEELQRLAPRAVTLVGGSAALSLQVEAQVNEALPDADVVRLAGEDRFETAAAIAAVIAARFEALPVPARELTVIIASGTDFPDALAATPAGIREQAPLLLTERDRLPRATADALRDMRPGRVVLVGGEAAISAQVAQDVMLAAAVMPERVSGPDRAATAAAIVDEFGPEAADVVVIVTGDTFPDALSAGAAATAVDGALLLSGTSTLPLATRQKIADLGPQVLLVVGGPAAVEDSVIERLQATPNAPYIPRELPS